MITVSHLEKSFGSVKAVDDISFEIKTGDIVGFLGPNGAGKSTTMRLLTGYLIPDSGTIHIDNKSLLTKGASALEQIGYLPENNPLYSDLLVKEFLSLSAELKHIPQEKRTEALDFAIESTAIKDVFFRPIGELSKGYKQRVGIAATIIHQPKTIILDEPTEGLDPNQRNEIRSLIKSLGKTHTIIMSTHVMQEAQAVCNRLLVINKGRLVADGSADQIAKTIGKQKVILFDLEGKYVDTQLQKLRDFEITIEKTRRPQRFVGRVFLTHGMKEIQPEISRLAAKNNWVIWKLTEQENKLEDIFAELTME